MACLMLTISSSFKCAHLCADLNRVSPGVSTEHKILNHPSAGVEWMFQENIVSDRVERHLVFRTVRREKIVTAESSVSLLVTLHDGYLASHRCLAGSQITLLTISSPSNRVKPAPLPTGRSTLWRGGFSVPSPKTSMTAVPPQLFLMLTFDPVQKIRTQRSNSIVKRQTKGTSQTIAPSHGIEAYISSPPHNL